MGYLCITFLEHCFSFSGVKFQDQISINYLFSYNFDKDGKQSTTTNVYPNLNQEKSDSSPNDSSSGNDFEDLSQEANEAKLTEAVAKMAELGFTGNWVRELLKNVNGDIAKAVEAMNPSK